MECLGSLIQAVLRADCGDLMKHERLDFHLGCTYPDSGLEAASLRKGPSFALRTWCLLYCPWRRVKTVDTMQNANKGTQAQFRHTGWPKLPFVATPKLRNLGRSNQHQSITSYIIFNYRYKNGNFGTGLHPSIPTRNKLQSSAFLLRCTPGHVSRWITVLLVLLVPLLAGSCWFNCFLMTDAKC